MGVEETFWEDIYHRVLRITWFRFFFVLSAVYLSLNLTFALLYFMLPDGIANIGPTDFLSNFFFSVQTMSTIGYGYFYPKTVAANLVVTVESFIGVFFTAVITGLVFSKFAKPSARIVFSENIIWTKQNGQDMIALRLGNVRTNRVFDGRAQLTLLRDETTSEGERIRRLVDLKLVRAESPLVALSWTLYHAVDEKSPLYGKTPEEMFKMGWEIFITFLGIDQEMSQTIVAHSTYPANRIIRAKKFVDMIHADQGVRVIDFSKIHLVEGAG